MSVLSRVAQSRLRADKFFRYNELSNYLTARRSIEEVFDEVDQKLATLLKPELYSDLVKRVGSRFELLKRISIVEVGGRSEQEFIDLFEQSFLPLCCKLIPGSPGIRFDDIEPRIWQNLSDNDREFIERYQRFMLRRNELTFDSLNKTKDLPEENEVEAEFWAKINDSDRKLAYFEQEVPLMIAESASRGRMEERKQIMVIRLRVNEINNFWSRKIGYNEVIREVLKIDLMPCSSQIGLEILQQEPKIRSCNIAMVPISIEDEKYYFGFSGNVKVLRTLRARPIQDSTRFSGDDYFLFCQTVD